MLTVAKVTQGQADDYAEYLEAKSEPVGTRTVGWGCCGGGV
jgi:hypothetical protein